MKKPTHISAICPDCRGVGAVAKTTATEKTAFNREIKACPSCQGRGVVMLRERRQGAPLWFEIYGGIH